jgi:hypothetical protein
MRERTALAQAQLRLAQRFFELKMSLSANK